MAEHDAVKEKDEKALKDDLRRDVQLSNELQKHRQNCLKLLTALKILWDGHLWRINMSKHWIYRHNKDIGLVHSESYW